MTLASRLLAERSLDADRIGKGRPGAVGDGQSGGYRRWDGCFRAAWSAASSSMPGSGCGSIGSAPSSPST